MMKALISTEEKPCDSYLCSSYYSQLNRFCPKLICLWTVTVFERAFPWSHVCALIMLFIRGLGNHYINISISRVIKHPSFIFIIICQTNILQSMDLQPGKTAQFGSNLQLQFWGVLNWFCPLSSVHLFHFNTEMFMYLCKSFLSKKNAQVSWFQPLNLMDFIFFLFHNIFGRL